MSRDFMLPDLGEGIAEAQVVQVLIAEGDQVAEDQAIIEVETDKAAVEIPSPYAGVAEKIHVEAGQTINVGDVMVSFSGNGDAKVAEAKVKKPAPAAAKPASAPAAPAQRGTGKTVPAAPAVRKLAREMGVDLAAVAGSGPGGRVLKADVEKAATGGGGSAAPVPPRPASLPGKAEMDKWGPTRRVGLSQIRKTIAKQMARSIYTIPHVTHTDDADITELERLRRGYAPRPGEPERKLTLMPFVIRAVASALRAHPELNASFDADASEMVYKDYVSVGVAVDTQRGLVVPVLRDADRLGILELSDALAGLADKARQAQFAVEELRGGTFTITNVGALGGRYSTPIINFPEVAILGLGRSRKEPRVVDDQIVPRVVLPLCLSFDHRATDGAEAARFTRTIVEQLENPARLMF